MPEAGVAYLEAIFAKENDVSRIFGHLRVRRQGDRLLWLNDDSSIIGSEHIEHVVHRLRGTVEGFSSPFPSKPKELADLPQVFHVESIGLRGQFVILVHPPHTRTLESEPEEVEPGLPGSLDFEDRSTHYTLRFPTTCWFLHVAAGLETQFATVFFLESERVSLTTNVCVPAMLNVSTTGGALLPYYICAPLARCLGPRTRRTLREEIARVEHLLHWTKFTWDLERHHADSAWRELRSMTSDSRLQSFAAWQRATLAGEDPWTPDNFIPVMTVYDHLVELCLVTNGLCDSLPYRLQSALLSLEPGADSTDYPEFAGSVRVIGAAHGR